MLTFVLMQFTFNKQEKLKSKKLIEKLFTEGKSVSAYPVKLIYLKIDHNADCKIQASVSVSKRKFKLAVNRNRIKRLLRESYRKNKHLIYNDLEGKYVFMFLYLDEKEHKYVVIEQIMINLLKKFLKKVNLK